MKPARPAHFMLAFALVVLLAGGYGLAFVHGLVAQYPQAQAVLRGDMAALVVLTALLLALLPWAGRASPRWASLVAGGLIGALFFFRTFGFAILDPTASDWLLHGDLAQHYLGWAMFRQEAWQWPPGAIEGLRHPVGTSVYFTDSMPLFALALKPFHAWLPTPFQYIGLIYLVHWMLMGAMTAAVARLASDRLVVHALAAWLAVLAPVLLARYTHDTLTGQWLVVAALGLALRRNRSDPPRPPSLWGWLPLVVIAAWTHFYLLAMVLAVLAADGMQAIWRDRIWPIRSAMYWLAIVATAVVFASWLAGAGMAFRGALDPAQAAAWSADLTSLVHPGYNSTLLRAVSAASRTQWEGQAFLGLGGMALILIAVAVAWRVPASRQMLRGSALLWLMAGALFVFALGTSLTVAGHTVFEIEWLRHVPLYGLFRACGRFVWVLHYLLLLAAIVVVARGGIRVAVPALLAACLLQVWDLRFPDRFGTLRVTAAEQAGAQWRDPRWSGLAQGRRHLQLVPGHGCGPVVVEDWFPFTQMAARHGLTVNGGYVARIDERKWVRYCARQLNELSSGIRHADTLYLVRADLLEGFIAGSGQVPHCHLLDEVNVCVFDDAGHRD